MAWHMSPKNILDILKFSVFYVIFLLLFSVVKKIVASKWRKAQKHYRVVLCCWKNLFNHHFHDTWTFIWECHCAPLPFLWSASPLRPPRPHRDQKPSSEDTCKTRVVKRNPPIKYVPVKTCPAVQEEVVLLLLLALHLLCRVVDGGSVEEVV